jgi:hypothetical protein
MKGDSNLGAGVGAGRADACGTEALTLVCCGMFSGAVASGKSSNAEAEGAAAASSTAGVLIPACFNASSIRLMQTTFS